MSIQEITQEFNATFIDMITQISEKISDDTIDSTICSALKVIIKNHPEKIIGIYIVHVLPHKDKIESGDENYFLNDNSNIDNTYKDDGPVIEKILTFKKLWVKLNENDKKIIIKYLTVLSYYATHYFNIYDKMNKI